VIHTLAISGYRSLRDVVLSLSDITVITGANGSGKSSLYRALRLLADVAQGRIVASLASEGGLQSTLWAGPEKFSRAMKLGEQPVQGVRRSGPVSVRLGFAGDALGYAIDLGLPIPGHSFFADDPEIKLETVWAGASLRPATTVAERRGASVRLRSEGSNAWRSAATDVSAFDSMMTRCADTADGLELLLLRDRMRNWRFYDDLRTDRQAAARQPQVGTFTPVLAGDGRDIAAAIQTIIEIDDGEGLQETIGDAFDGAHVSISPSCEIEMHQHGLLRPMRGAELSDGTLRYLLLVAALLSPRPPELMILNEPEASLHPDLLAPLARLIARAARDCQIIVVSHAAPLVEALAEHPSASHVVLTKELGETIAQQDARPPSWTWPSR
jgi:predicted ATPase